MSARAGCNARENYRTRAGGGRLYQELVCSIALCRRGNEVSLGSVRFGSGNSVSKICALYCSHRNRDGHRLMGIGILKSESAARCASVGTFVMRVMPARRRKPRKSEKNVRSSKDRPPVFPQNWFSAILISEIPPI